MKNILIDLETYPNFWLCGWADLDKGTYCAYTEEDLDYIHKMIMEDMPYFIGFNSYHYDLRILKYAIANRRNPDLVKYLKVFNDFIIKPETVDERWKEEFSKYKNWNYPNLDLQSVLGGRICPSLKKLACRLHLNTVESLPIDPDTNLTDDQKQHIISYNRIDIINTKRLLEHCRPLLEMRQELSNIYRTDCRSLGDAQIAERIIGSQLGPNNRDNFSVEYKYPIRAIVKDFKYDCENLQKFLNRLKECRIQFEESYNPGTKKTFIKKYFDEKGELLESLDIDEITPPCQYKFGGLHSIHKKCCAGKTAYEVDAASFYPNLILKFGIYPSGVDDENFLKIYKSILDRRLEAKRLGKKIEADALKIVVNSTFGKYNEYHSKLFDPVSGAAVCLSGQCAILRLCDLCYQANIEIMLINTDGIICKQNPVQVMDKWQKELGMILEMKEICNYLIKDSNNFILKYCDGSRKIKGVAFNYEKDIRKQTNFPVCHQAIVNKILDNTPVEETIMKCTNIHMFLGAYQKGETIVELKKAIGPLNEGEIMPKLVRFYVGKSGYSLFRNNGKTWTRIADSKDFVECNQIPLDFPADLNYDYYIQKSNLALGKLKC